MQQSKPPIAAKPKIPASRRFAGKVANSNLKIEFENKLTFSCDRTKNRSILKSSSQSFESLNSINKFHDEANEKHEKMSKNEPGCNNVSVNIQQSTVQQMKSKLFAKQQSEVTKVNKNDLSTASNKILQEKYSKELEKFLGMRNTQHSNLKNEKALKRLSRSFDESLSEATVENASSEMQQKVLAAELKHAHSEIKKNVVEHVPVQQRYDEYKNTQKPTNLLSIVNKPKIMDEEIKKTIESVLGKDIEIVDSHQTRSVQEEEVLFINGVAVKLEGSEATSIREALKTGKIPSCALLSQLLLKAGILRQPVQIETSLSVKSSLITTEEIRVAKNGSVLEDRMLETKEDNLYESSCSEVWEPLLNDPLSCKNASNIVDVDLHCDYVKRNKITATNPSSPIRQNSVCTNGSISSVSTSSRPTSDLSLNRSDMNLYDNIQSYLMHHQGHSTGIIPKASVSSYDSGHDFSSPSATSFTTEKTTDSLSVDDVDFQKIRFHSDVKLKPQTTMPTTVANDQSPKDMFKKRSFPQETSTSTESCPKNVECDDNTLLYRDGNLLSASLDALIQHMVPTNEYFPDRSYAFAFLLSSRLFIKPHQLLIKIWDISQHQQNLNTKHYIQQKLAQKSPQLAGFTKNFVEVLDMWVDNFPYDFRDDRLMSELKDVTHICAQINPSIRAEVSQLLQKLLLKLKSLESYEAYIRKLNCDSFDGKSSDDKASIGLQQQVSIQSSHSHKSNSSNSSSTVASMLTCQENISELCSSPLQLAHQLTHIELTHMEHIGPEEFVEAFAKEQSSLEAPSKKTRNLEIYVDWFNRLSYLVCTDVIKHSKKKQRARVIEFWIETAREAFDIGNFNSLMAIIAGLNMSPISRLKKTWAKIQSNSKFSILEHQMDSSSNFSSYRATLRAAQWRSAGATNEREKIVIPFFSLLIKDLYFLNEGCSNRLPNGHINFEKFWQLSKNLTEFLSWKQVNCPFDKNEFIIKYLQTTSILEENTLALASFECEPPENNHEKDHLKILKNELK